MNFLKAKEALKLFHIHWYWPRFDGFDFLKIGLYSVYDTTCPRKATSFGRKPVVLI